MTIEDELKTLILTKYKSIREFSFVLEMPYSTIDTILKRGIQKASVTNIIKICKQLGISADKLADGKIVQIVNAGTSFDSLTFEEQKLIKKYRALNQRGKNFINRTVDTEYEYIISRKEEEEKTKSLTS